jgi:hypothetical protein
MKNLATTTSLAPWLKIAATGGILLGAAAIVGSGAFAVWTSSATADATINAGSVNISMSDSNIVLNGMAPGDTVQQLLTIGFPQTTATGNAVSGIKMSVVKVDETLGNNLSAVGTSGFNDLSGGSLFNGSAASEESTTAYPDGTFGKGAVLGSSALTYTIDTCSVQWTKASPTSPFVCEGVTSPTAGGVGSDLNTITTTSPLELVPNNFDKSLATTPQLAFVANDGAVAIYSMISITLPWSANNSFAGASVALTFNASAVQRAAVTTAPTSTPVL